MSSKIAEVVLDIFFCRVYTSPRPLEGKKEFPINQQQGNKWIIIGLTVLAGACLFFGITDGIRTKSRGLFQTRVVLLGTGTPNAEPDRSGPAAAVIVKDTAYIIDCGPGVVRRAAEAARRGEKALEPSRLDKLFVTHLHSDHTAGLPDLILTPWVLGRDKPLTVFGPPGTRKMARTILDAYEEDILVRTEGREPVNREGFKVDVQEISAGVVYRDRNVMVTAFPVHHGAWRHAFGFRFEGPDRVIVISGDRAPEPDISDYCQGCDILVHEVYSVAGFKTRPPDWQAYHRDAHTSSVELGRLAAEVKPGLLVLTHELLWGVSPEDLLKEIKRVYDGRVVFGKDLDIY
jgi:ribonuclease BN (tRNA processing enzyme)